MADESGIVENSIESLKNKINSIIQNYETSTESTKGNLTAIALILFENLHTMKQMILDKQRKNSDADINDFQKDTEFHIHALREDDLAVNPNERNGSHAGTSSSTAKDFGDQSASIPSVIANLDVDKSISDYIDETDIDIETLLSENQVSITHLEGDIQVLIEDLCKRIKIQIIDFQIAAEKNVAEWKKKVVDKIPKTKSLLQEILTIIESTSEKVHSITNAAIRHLEIEAEETIERFRTESTSSIDTIQLELIVITDELRKAVKNLTDNLKIETAVEKGHLQLEANGVLEILYVETELVIKEFHLALGKSIKNVKEELEIILTDIHKRAIKVTENLNEEVKNFLDYCENDLRKDVSEAKME